MSGSGPTLDQVKSMMRDRGARRLLVKFLSPNDNSKNQIYLGGDLGVINVIPAGDPVAATSGSHAEPIFKVPLRLSWLDREGRAFPAPHSQLILYPQYPEVRMSGFLRGAKWAPTDLMTVRDEGRVLLLGITAADEILGYAAGPTSAVANELRGATGTEEVGVFRRIPLEAGRLGVDSRSRLLTELCRIARKGWIPGWTLGPNGSSKPCTASNCVGVTLESELGITANGRSEPDFEGWEVKGHTVANLAKPGSGAVTLMTPEPNGGFYVEEGVIAFVRRFGYKDKRGREDRYNFGGVHRVGSKCAATGLSLELRGYEHDSQTITRSDGMLALVNDSGFVAASWNFAGLLAHWRRKHARAAFVPALKRRNGEAAFQYGDRVLLAEGTDYLRLLDGLAEGVIYYDPGIKVESASTSPTAKRRSQIRVSRAGLGRLYHSSANYDACRR